MKTILLSIKPEYANKILLGTKKYEYRTRVPKSQISGIFIYSTSPVKKIIGYVKVIGITMLPLDDLWDKTKEFS
jgi:predicted transcriptional regulator